MRALFTSPQSALLSFPQRSSLTSSRPSRSAFKRLDSDLVQLRLSIPREFSLSQLLIDGDTRRPLVCSVPHLATILLHEPFASLDPNDSASNDQCQLSARSILDVLYTIYGSSYDGALISPFLNFVWGVAGRELRQEFPK